MKIKYLIKELEYFYLQDKDAEVLAYLYDKDTKTEYECDFTVEGDIVPMLNLADIKNKYETDLSDFEEKKPTTTYRFEVFQEVDINAKSQEDAEEKLKVMFSNFFYEYLGEVDKNGNAQIN